MSGTTDRPNLVVLKVATTMHANEYDEYTLWLSDKDAQTMAEIIENNKEEENGE